MDSVSAVMSKDLIVIHESASPDSAYQMMKKNMIRHLPVINDIGHVVGILSDRDLQRALTSKFVGEGVNQWESCEFDPTTLVSDYMTWPVKTVDTGLSLKSVTESMLREKVSCYLVTNDAEIVGIVTTDDLLKYLVKLLNEHHVNWRQSLAEAFSFEKAGAFAQKIADVGI